MNATQEGVQCPNALAVRVNGQTVVRRCRGDLVSSNSNPGYHACSQEGEEMLFEDEVVESFTTSPLWHKVYAVNKMLSMITPNTPTAYNSSYPWIDIPLGLNRKAVVETTTGFWTVHIHEDDHPIETRPTEIPLESEDTEAAARAIAAVL